MSLEILDEYRHVLDELSGRFPEVDTSGLLEFVTVNSTICYLESLDEQICDDSDDDKFLACALASGAKVLITGDKVLLRVGHLQSCESSNPLVLGRISVRVIPTGSRHGCQCAVALR